MAGKFSTLIGMSIKDFQAHVEEKKVISVRSARLIPVFKPGDEMGLTSLFLSSLRLVKEFRKDIFSSVNLSRAGKIYVFTEVCFKELKGEQPDGLIIVVSAGKIKDAALLEVKNGKSILKEEQILNYLNVARRYKIPKLITVSNQFVSTPTQSPLNIKVPQKPSLFHLSWSLILTKAHILLFDNDTNIEDEDQVEIMREVVKFLEHEKSGVTGFTVMKRGWKSVTEKIRSGSAIKKDDPDVIDAVTSWLQEERDMALILSRNLGLLVKSGINRFKNNLKGRIEHEIKNLISTKELSSKLQVKNLPSDIKVTACFESRQIRMEVTMYPPEDKTNRRKISWIRNQIIGAQKRNTDKFDKVANDLAIFVYLAWRKDPEKVLIADLEEAWEKFKDREVKKFGVRYEKSLKGKFVGVQTIVNEIETMLIDFYSGIVEHLKVWVKPTPKTHPDPKSLDTLE